MKKTTKREDKLFSLSSKIMGIISAYDCSYVELIGILELIKARYINTTFEDQEK